MPSNTNSTGHRKLVVTTLAALLAAMVLVLLAWTNLASGGEDDTTAPLEKRTPAAFSLLKAAEANDHSDITREIESMLVMTSAVGKNPELLAVGKADSEARGSFTAVQIDDQLCVRDSGGLGGVCADVETALEKGLYLALPESCSTVRVAGLMPDGVEVLRVEQKDHAVRDIPVRDDIFDVRLPSNATKVTSQDGAVSFDLPLDSFVSMAGGCG